MKETLDTKNRRKLKDIIEMNDDLESDLEDKIDEKIGELREYVDSDPNRIRSNVEMQLQDLSYPYGLKMFLRNYKIPDKVDSEHINEIKEKFDCQFFLLRKKHYDSNRYIDNSVRIRSGKELLDYSRAASFYNKPVLVYYGISQVYSGIMNSLVGFSTRKIHGISMKEELWTAKLEKGGFFKKLTLFMEILENHSLFRPYFYKNSVNRTTFTSNIHKFFDYSTRDLDLVKLNREFGAYHASLRDYTLRRVDYFLLNFINIFHFSSLSRYRPLEWHNILEGTDFMYKIVEKTFREVDEYIDWFIHQVQFFVNRRYLFLINR